MERGVTHNVFVSVFRVYNESMYKNDKTIPWFGYIGTKYVPVTTVQ